METRRSVKSPAESGTRRVTAWLREVGLGSIRWNSHVFLLAGFALFVLAPLTAPGYFGLAHDSRHSVYFLQMFDLSMRDGAWYPRWATDMVFGYGYPLWLILAPIPFYAGQAFHLVGFDFVSAVKIVDGLAIFFSALAMFVFASRVLGRNAGLVAAVAYAYIPYHLVDLYVRAAQAELVAYVFPPLVFWAFYQLAGTRRMRFVSLAGLAYAGLMLSHIQTAFLFTPIIGVYLIYLFFAAGSRASALRFAASSAAALALSLGLGAIFLLPVLVEQRYLTTDPLIGGFFNFRDHFLNANQLLSPFWGYGYAGVNGADQFSLQLGLLPTLLGFVAVIALGRTRGTIRSHIIFFAACTLGAVFLTLPISSRLWESAAAIVAYTQFPWRLLSVSAFALAFLCGGALFAFPRDARGLAPALAAVLLFVGGNYAYTEPQHTDAVFNYQTQMDFEVKDRELLGDTIWMTGPRPQASPLVEEYVKGEVLQKAIAADGDASVKMVAHGGQSDEVHVDATRDSLIMFYTRYFPGWTAWVDGQPEQVQPYGEQGLIAVKVPAGSHDVLVRYEDTPPMQAGTIISAVSLLVTAALLARERGDRQARRADV